MERRDTGPGLVAAALVLLLGVMSLGCEDEVSLTLPDEEDVEEAYTYEGRLSASMSGNVAEVRIVQADRQLRRGGTLWAKVGPYILRFSQ